MKAIIPTAGVGARLRPFTNTLPKVLLQVAEKPILGHILDKLLDIGVRDVTCVVGYRGRNIERYIGASYPNIRARFVEQSEPRGLGHAIHLAAKYHKDNDEPLLIILGDTIIDADLTRLEDSPDDLIGVHVVEDPRRFGIVEIGPDGVISALTEKPEHPATNQAIVGVYYIKRPAALFEALADSVANGQRDGEEIQLTDALQKMIERGVRLRAFPIDGWHDCGKPETLLATNKALLSQRPDSDLEEIERRYPTARITHPVWIDPSAQIHNSIVGPNATVAAGAKLTNSIVHNSIINAGAMVENVILADSIIGNDARVRRSSIRLYVGDQSEIIQD